MKHLPIHLEHAFEVTKVAIQMYQARKISHDNAMARFERALGHVDRHNAEQEKKFCDELAKDA